ncbi:DUF6115 domain-containing protein [Ureibacillus sinduriensis]|uniref:Swarming motility protein SwrB n=1 Tax=Ureibacillus sinduriensis BLB-1 = JCM 15800 TaxID=1384057 RepID=A0A0A3HRU1_9BACL|nr:hypothetical protein [Ureibacillus sinduriensis]KGR73920.1 hypothetical protein CD33_18080 [Ureibacillus sinduriensis BLB-1 = JCM 15800]
MVASLVIILIISQLICYYFIVILNTKIAKFKDLEKRQDQLIREMDDAISIYLVEMKEENDRLIEELSLIKQNERNHERKDQNMAMMNSEERKTISEVTRNDMEGKVGVLQSNAPKATISKKMATNAYKQQRLSEVPSEARQEHNEEVEKDNSSLPSFEQKVLNLHKQGKSIDEIAKLTQKGKTEIELLIKFHA